MPTDLHSDPNRPIIVLEFWSAIVRDLGKGLLYLGGIIGCGYFLLRIIMGMTDTYGILGFISLLLIGQFVFQVIAFRQLCKRFPVPPSPQRVAGPTNHPHG
jgi:hypothetical protein